MTDDAPLHEALAQVGKALERVYPGLGPLPSPRTIDECRAVIDRAIAALTPTTEPCPTCDGIGKVRWMTNADQPRWSRGLPNIEWRPCPTCTPTMEDTVTDEWTWIDERQADAAFAQMEEDTVTDDRSYGQIAYEAAGKPGPFYDRKHWEAIAEATAAAVRDREGVGQDRIPDELVELLRAWRHRMRDYATERYGTEQYAKDRMADELAVLMDWCDEHLPPEPDPLDAWADAMLHAYHEGDELRAGMRAAIAALPESAREAMRKEAP